MSETPITTEHVAPREDGHSHDYTDVCTTACAANPWWESDCSDDCPEDCVADHRGEE